MVFTLTLKNLPFEKLGNQVVYTESEYDEKVNRYIQKNYEAIKENFKSNGLEFIYLPKLLEELKNKEIIRYNAPYAERLRDDIAISSDFMLQFMVNPEEKKSIHPSLVYFCYQDYSKDNVFVYKGVELNSGSGYKKTDNLSNILLIVTCEKSEPSIWDKAFAGLKNFNKEIVEEENDAYKESALPKRYIRPKESEEDFDSETQEMIKELKEKIEKLKLAGVPEYLLLNWVYGEEKLSRLFISKEYRIFLTDYDNAEVELRPLPKTLFFLYLRHPEGIRFKDLSDYHDEIVTIYKAVKLGFYNLTEAQVSIDLLCNSTKNSASEKSHHIRCRFSDKMKERIAKNYCIEGPQAGTKKIVLPRDMVTWEKPI